MGSTREQVLQNLLNRQRCTINELADAVSINPISVRHHITRLEADGLVSSEEERHGVGRPRRIYFLTNKGMEKFPTRYLNLSLRLVNKLKETLPENTLETLFKELGTGMAESGFSNVDFSNLDLGDRVELTRKVLVNEGFNVQVSKEGDDFHIMETSCPYVHIGKEHPEICIVDESLISTMLSIPVQKTECILNGDNHCVYVASENGQKN
ncbi:MAG: winged helix-turn-helix transcriptional regulator [Chloroflexi bacterium]|jgi:DeoR family transcriptional regulator, suf operon transcriptional repressor|nr:winged helix-turn-helix transcriptional regulator [Chloroflexota bacterium]MBT3668933.1 winged helix-turn-helix transcriptional regulator [Chloroflexota bacterium]MBT4305340.1 winged helix-turn-helix transcriptional regulator [Chloroflexota bacterium]MBT4532486.1 winged helix-turn-helix transcriptional regulator [Chloroflexota bacterium]MBT4683147.1 winged helix-turn-helix transcriptional regulator [Chloroflexota bacterium]